MTAPLLLALLSLAQAPETAPAGGGRELFVKNCAACHGESGDGRGTVQLEKLARSFRDGGFSYGNTPEALERTIRFGIPGTPMPSFGSALGEAGCQELARYVLELGPPQAEVKRSDTLLSVREQPLFARGKLPAIVEGAPETVRGLLVGTLEGLSFEYRADDLRLLGVRQGEFVERRDWSGRGGDALLPLGRIVHVSAGGRPGATARWIRKDGPPVELAASLRATRAQGGLAHVLYTLRSPAAGARLEIEVDESLRAASAGPGAGFARRIELGERAALAWPGRCPSPCLRTELARGPAWLALRRADGVCELHGLRAPRAGDEIASEGAEFQLRLASEAPAGRTLELLTILAPAWDESLRAAWEAELRP
jgi:mono/diheme cytochrome c family protein